jgi:hypothetical protein
MLSVEASTIRGRSMVAVAVRKPLRPLDVREIVSVTALPASEWPHRRQNRSSVSAETPHAGQPTIEIEDIPADQGGHGPG